MRQLAAIAVICLGLFGLTKCTDINGDIRIESKTDAGKCYKRQSQYLDNGRMTGWQHEEWVEVACPPAPKPTQDDDAAFLLINPANGY